MKKGLAFRNDGTFTIVQFTDVHWQNGEPKDLKTLELMERILDWEAPDFVIFTGDQIRGEYCREPLESYRQSLAAVNRRGIPWASVFGNHDDELAVTREQLFEVQQESDACLTQRGPRNITGVGNFVLTVAGGDGMPKAAVYGIDSGGFVPGKLDEYAWIKRDQIEWYVSESSRLSRENGGPLPSLAFFHIPLPEYEELWNSAVCYGSKYEGVGSPKLNSGFFAALVECGDVMGTFVGHDHINDYWGDHHGIRLCYGRATGYNTYGREGFPRGARIIRLREGVRDFESWIRLDDGTVIREQEEHQPIGRVPAL